MAERPSEALQQALGHLNAARDLLHGAAFELAQGEQAGSPRAAVRLLILKTIAQVLEPIHVLPVLVVSAKAVEGGK